MFELPWFKKSESKFPLYVGLDHDNLSLKRKARRIVKKHGSKGKTLFIECPPLSSEEIATQLKIDGSPFLHAIIQAKTSGMKVVFLDTHKLRKIIEGRAEKVYNPLNPPTDYEMRKWNFIVWNLREKWWHKILKKAGPGDIIIMHQNHLKRILPAIAGEKKVLYESKPNVPGKGSGPLTEKEVMALKKERIWDKKEQRKIKAELNKG